jgi:hypothetical protein
MRSLYIILFISMSLFGLSFVNDPAIVQNGSTWTVTFEVDEATDVDVSIVNTVDSTVIRHLAAGVLGADPPAPLTANSFAQTLTWDGKDDMGNTVNLAGSSLGVRVRAGMGAVFDRVCGGSPFAFNGTLGIVSDASGHIFVSGGAGRNDFVSTREFNGTGDYVKTVYPYAASFSTAQISGFGVNNWLNGDYSPKTTRVHGPDISSTIVSKSSTQLIAFEPPGSLIYGNIKSNTMLKINADGSIENSSVPVDIVTSPPFLSSYYIGGPHYAAISPDGGTLYLSGIYETSKFAQCCDADTTLLAPDTGFWRDGRVFRVDMNTGVAVPVITLDSVPVMVRDRISTIGPENSGWGHHLHAAIHGVALDDSGHIFICDRLHSRIGVYDTSGTYLGGVPVKYPDRVAINRNTGELYVIARNYRDVCNLYKFPGWRNTPAALCSLTLTDNIRWNQVPFMTVSLSGATPMVWLAYHSFGVRAYRDDGNALTLLRDFAQESQGVNIGFDRIAVDRRNENVYFNNSWAGLYKITDWSNPAVLPCTTSIKQELTATDLTISPDNQLYIQEGPRYSGPITRWNIDGHYIDSLPFPNSGRNELTHYIYGRMHGVGGFGEKGLAVARDKRVAVSYLYNWANYIIGIFADSGCMDSTQHVDTIIKPIDLGGWGGSGPHGGVRFDSKGNLYFGAGMRSANHQIPSGFENDDSYKRCTGAVIRYLPGVKGSVERISGIATATNADKIYPQGLSPFSTQHHE